MRNGNGIRRNVVRRMVAVAGVLALPALMFLPPPAAASVPVTPPNVNTGATSELTVHNNDGSSNPATCGLADGDASFSASTLDQCISACKNGEKAIEQFCRGIPDPRIRAGCWAVVLGSTTACIGWCYLHYS